MKLTDVFNIMLAIIVLAMLGSGGEYIHRGGGVVLVALTLLYLQYRER